MKTSSRPAARIAPSGFPFKKLVVRNPFLDEFGKFEQLARECLDAGVTHLSFSEIDIAHWAIDDPKDPYLHWSILVPAPFKICPPNILRHWVPKSYSKRAQTLVNRRAKILKKVGLKGALYFYDPMWWPEDVYEKHPHLRGPRVDHATRSLAPRFAPCVDQPEVLAMYREAYRELAALSEGVLDLVVFRANDSGTGICWCNYLYPGANGPTGCKSIPFAERITRLMTAIHDGIVQAGGDADVYPGGSFGVDERAALLAAAPPWGGFYNHRSEDLGGDRIMSCSPTALPSFPVMGVSDPVDILNRLTEAREQKFPNLILFSRPTMHSSNWNGDALMIRAMGHYLRMPGNGFLDKVRALREIAENEYGAANAEDMVTAWDDLHQGNKTLEKHDRGGNLLLLGCMNQRWTTRPFVVFPEKLSSEEKELYRPYLFQANEAHESPDLLNLQGDRQFDGKEHHWFFRSHFDYALKKFNHALVMMKRALERRGPNLEKLSGEIEALEILMCFLRNVRNAIDFQIAKEGIEQFAPHANANPELRPLIKSDRVALYEIMRSEIDNTNRLADLLEETQCRHLSLARTKVEEGPFLFGPHLVKDLRLKVKIMLNHWLDFNQLIQPPKL